MCPRILIIEDEPEYRAMLQRNLEAEGCRVVTAPDGRSGLALHWADPAEVILLDLMLPGMDGLQVLRTLRALRDEVPVLMLTARSEPEMRLKSFEAGVDDFLAKPFALSELLQRVERLLRRSGPGSGAAPGTVLRSGPFRLDLETRTFFRGEKPLDVGLHGVRILAVLLPGAGRLHSRQELLARAWGAAERPGSRTLDAAVALIWQALGEERAWLSSVGGLGFRWQPPAAVQGASPEDPPCRLAT